MASRPAEMSFQKGVRSLESRKYLESMAYFESALNLEERMGNAKRRMKYLSYYGLSLSLAAGRTDEAIEMCEKALSVEFYNPDLYYNVARVYMSSGQRRKAYRAICQGLRLERSHAGLLSILRQLGMRRRPLFSFLSRGHVLNRVTGQLASRMR